MVGATLPPTSSSSRYHKLFPLVDTAVVPGAGFSESVVGLDIVGVGAKWGLIFLKIGWFFLKIAGLEFLNGYNVLFI